VCSWSGRGGKSLPAVQGTGPVSAKGSEVPERGKVTNLGRAKETSARTAKVLRTTGGEKKTVRREREQDVREGEVEQKTKTREGVGGEGVN